MATKRTKEDEKQSISDGLDEGINEILGSSLGKHYANSPIKPAVSSKKVFSVRILESTIQLLDEELATEKKRTENRGLTLGVVVEDLILEALTARGRNVINEDA